MNKYINNLSWSCSICGNVRLDEFISVRRFDVSAKWNMPRGSAHQNIRYCNDE